MQKTNSTIHKVALTGGHAATSALAVIEKIQEQHPEWEIMWIGSNQAFAKEKAATLDFQLFPEMGVKCYSIKAGKLHRNFSLNTFVDLFKIPIGFLQALKILSQERPGVILSFGGYSAFPVTVAGWLLRIPALIHEQTLAVGLANKLSTPFVKEVLLSRRQSAEYFKKIKTRLVGLPLHNALQGMKVNRNSVPERLFFTAGSRGSVTMNNALGEILEELLSQFTIVHQTGQLDFSKFEKIKSELPLKLRGKYKIKHTFTPSEMAENYAKADLVISRAGAHSAAEIMLFGKAAIFVPIPWVQKNEQFKNAELAEKYTKAIILEEKNLNRESLKRAIERIVSNWKKYKDIDNNPISQRDKNAASEIVKIMEEYV